jgi:hypothetical protein
MPINYSKLEGKVWDRFNRYGTDIYFHHKVDGDKNDVTGATDYNYLTTKVKGIQQSYGDIFMDGDNIQKGDKQLLISARHGRPSLADEVEIDNVYYKVINVKELQPADTNLMYEVHVRSYAVGEDIDRLFVDLGSLEAGSVVSDPNRQNTPIWRVIAHDHHKAGHTTLICDQVWALISFSGQVEVGVPTAQDPWSKTYMRRWLHNEFMKELSAKMNQFLAPVTVITMSERITDRVSLPSRMELFDIKQSGLDDGKWIPYFEADSFRIASYDDPKRTTDVNTEYWTRDAYGVGADGKQKTFNPNYVHGVRPMIFLNSQYDTALNYNGYYEIQFPD